MSQAIKLLVSGVAGAGKTELLRTLDDTVFVVSRDSKEFPLSLPHMMVDKYYDMSTLLYGGDVQNDEGEPTYVEGVMDKMHKYFEHFGKYPKTVVWDSVSQLTMDVIDVASQTPNVYGSQGAEVTKEMALLTKFIHEELELKGVNVILLTHVTEGKDEGKPNGQYEQFGSGKFLAKGAFYSATNEAITIVPEGTHRAVYTRGINKQARTMLPDIPTKLYLPNIIDPDKSKRLKEGEEYFSLAEHLAKLAGNQNKVTEEFRF